MAMTNCGTGCAGQLTKEGVAQWVGINMFPGDREKTNIMTAVAMAESGGCPKCYNGSCCVGLLQINLNHAGEHGSPKNRTEFHKWLESPDNNTRIGRKIWERGGFNEWQAYTNGSWKKFYDSSLNTTGQAGPTGDLSIGDILSDAAAMFKNPLDVFSVLVQPIKQVIDIVVNATKWITNPDNWIRIMQVGGGVLLAAIAASIVLKPTIQDVKKTVSPI